MNGILTDIELLASKLLSTALTVRQSPQSGGAAQRLGILRKHWSAKVDALTDVIDDITDVVLFVDASGEFLLSPATSTSFSQCLSVFWSSLALFLSLPSRDTPTLLLTATVNSH